MTKICLNMIVKNEADVIRRCLDSVRPFIDYWVIVDTGSGDGTQKIVIDHFRDVPGVLYERQWKDFGYNRSEAITLAAGHGDYLLFIDADDFLSASPDFKMPTLTHGAYELSIIDNNLRYWRKAIVSQSLSWRYVGVLHEYVECAKAHTTSRIEGLSIMRNVGGTGLTETEMIEKYRGHAVIFEEVIKREPDNSRYVFYLAQSYRDSQQLQLSLTTYRKRVKMGGWEEEIWCSKFQIASLSERLKQNFDDVVMRYLEAHEYRPSRAEALTSLARFCREHKRFRLAELFAEQAAKIPMTNDNLFVEISAYQWRAIDELSVAKYWTGDYAGCAALSLQLLASPYLPVNERQRITDNLRFAQDKLIVRPIAIETRA